MPHSAKRVRILALIDQSTPPRTIIEQATKPDTDCNAIRCAMQATRQNVAKQWDDELIWQVTRLRAWLSDEQPSDLPIMIATAADFLANIAVK